jgi:hypothetical protein
MTTKTFLVEMHVRAQELTGERLKLPTDIPEVAQALLLKTLTGFVDKSIPADVVIEILAQIAATVALVEGRDSVRFAFLCGRAWDETAEAHARMKAGEISGVDVDEAIDALLGRKGPRA